LLKTFADHFRGHGTFVLKELPGPEVWIDLTNVHRFLAKSNKHLVYLERVGAIKKEKIWREEAGFQALRSLLDIQSARSTPSVYQYTVIPGPLLSSIHEDLLHVYGCDEEITVCLPLNGILLVKSG